MKFPVFEELKILIVTSELPLGYIARRAELHRMTLKNWLNGKVAMPHLDAMMRVAWVLHRHEITLTPTVRKMFHAFPEPASKRAISMAEWLQ